MKYHNNTSDASDTPTIPVRQDFHITGPQLLQASQHFLLLLKYSPISKVRPEHSTVAAS